MNIAPQFSFVIGIDGVCFDGASIASLIKVGATKFLVTKKEARLAGK